MIRRVIVSADEAQSAFYESFEKANLEQMMSVWAQDEFITCIHPNGPRLTGVAEVREGWRQILSHSPKMRFQIREISRTEDRDIVIYHVTEAIRLQGSKQAKFRVIATNVFRRTRQGWRMILHHASATPDAEHTAADAEEHGSANDKVTLH